MSILTMTTRDDLASASPQLRRILVATDFSAGARSALDCTLSLAKLGQTKIYLTHVIPAGALQYVSHERAEEVILQARLFASEEMKRLLKESDSDGLIQTDILSGGGVWPQLQEFVKSQAIDLLVMGTHGRTTAQKQLLGPVAEEIFRLADCPVLTVGWPVKKPALAASGVQRILYATNFKPHAERAAPLAHSMEHSHDAQLAMLHVVEEQHSSPTGCTEIVRQFITERMKKGLPAGCVGKPGPEFLVRFGDPAEQMLQAARELRSDLIIMGLRARKNVAGQLPSEVAYKVACQSPCPVLTTRH
jgi:nucleotide-binding universal stress UspA family protein